MFLSSLFSAFTLKNLLDPPDLRKELREEKRERPAAPSRYPTIWKLLIAETEPKRSIVAWEELDSRWLKIVGRATTGEELVELYKEHEPNVVLLDIKLARADERESLRQIREIREDARIVVLTENATERAMGEARLLRAKAVLPIDSYRDQIEAAIQTALDLTV